MSEQESRKEYQGKERREINEREGLGSMDPGDDGDLLPADRRSKASGWTPEPWKAERSPHQQEYAAFITTETLESPRGDVCAVYTRSTINEGPDNAARIVACVNALAGVADPAAFVAAVDRLASESSGLDDQIKGIGFEDWHGAEGFDCKRFRSALSALESARRGKGE